MENSIAQFRDGVAQFFNHLESSSAALLQSLHRRPIPLDSASSTFVQCLNRRVSTTATDLNLLESMSFDMVSFEELLGHCNEVYKKNQIDILDLEDRVSAFGYVPEVETDEPGEEVFNDIPSNGSLDMKYTRGDGALFEDSLSLQTLGLSDASLATIVSEGKTNVESDGFYQPAINISDIERNEQYELKTIGDSQSLINISQDAYESLPSYMRSLSSWEDLLVAVEKMNLSLKGKRDNGNFFSQDEIGSLELGPKARSYLLLLVRMNRLVVEIIDGLISYRVIS